MLLYVVNSAKGGTKLSNFFLDIKCEVRTIVSCFKGRLFVAMIRKRGVFHLISNFKLLQCIRIQLLGILGSTSNALDFRK